MNDHEPIGLIKSRVPGRIRPERVAAADDIYDDVFRELTTRPWNTYLLHQPFGWADGSQTMTGAHNEWTARPGYPKAYASAIGGAFATRDDLKEVWVYLGLIWTSAYYNGGNNKNRPLADPGNKTHVIGMLKTVEFWMLCGVTGIIFDYGAVNPEFVLRWGRIIRRTFGGHVVIGLEALAQNPSRTKIDWEAAQEGVHYHANTRFRRDRNSDTPPSYGPPFKETVPSGINGFAWIHRDPVPTEQELLELLSRNWRLAPHESFDAEVLKAVAASHPTESRGTVDGNHE